MRDDDRDMSKAGIYSLWILVIYVAKDVCFVLTVFI